MIRLLIGPASLAIMLTLSACASTLEYGPISSDQAYGYAETKREDGSYILRIVHPSGDVAMSYWDRRAAELCGSTAYEKNIYTAIRPTMHYSNYGGMPGAAQLEGILVCRNSAG